MENMISLEEIKANRERLEFELRQAASLMIKTDKIAEIRAAIQANQELCPHTEGASVCPYCGKKLEE